MSCKGMVTLSNTTDNGYHIPLVIPVLLQWLHLAEKCNYVAPEWILHNIQGFGDTDMCETPQFLLLFNNIICNSLLFNQESQGKLFLENSALLGKNYPYVSW